MIAKSLRGTGFILLMALSAAVVSSCGNEGDDLIIGGEESDMISLTKEPDHIVIANDGDGAASGSLFIDAEGDWKVTVVPVAPDFGDVSWVSVTPMSGKKGTHKVDYTAMPNTTGSPRRCIIKVSTADDNQQVAVCQETSATPEDIYGLGGKPSGFSSPSKIIDRVEFDRYHNGAVGESGSLTFEYGDDGAVRRFRAVNFFDYDVRELVGEVFFDGPMLRCLLVNNGAIVSYQTAFISDGKAALSYNVNYRGSSAARLGRRYYYTPGNNLSRVAAEKYAYMCKMVKFEENFSCKWSVLRDPSTNLNNFQGFGYDGGNECTAFSDARNDANLDLNWLCLYSPVLAGSGMTDISVLGWFNCLGERSGYLPSSGPLSDSLTYEDGVSDSSGTHPGLTISSYDGGNLSCVFRIYYR